MSCIIVSPWLKSISLSLYCPTELFISISIPFWFDYRGSIEYFDIGGTPLGNVIKLFWVVFRYLFFHNIIYQGLLSWTSKYKLNPNFNCLLDILAWISNRHLNLTVSPTTKKDTTLWICFPKFIFLLSFPLQHHLIDCLFAPPPTCNLSNYGLGCKSHLEFVLEPLHAATCFCNEQLGGVTHI